METMLEQKQFLHVGCGPQSKAMLKGFDAEEWQEIRLDIDPGVNPDIVGSLTDMSAVDTGSMDAVYSAHNIEHLFAHEVPLAIAEFHRVLKPDGFLLLRCPDIQSVCEAVAQDRLLEPLYTSPSGPISPIDILYGHRRFIADGNHFMAHKVGFTYKVLAAALFQAGFQSIFGGRVIERYELNVLAYKQDTPESRMKEEAGQFIR